MHMHHIHVLFRGFLQRVKFRVQLSQYCSQKHHYQLMVDYGQRVASDHSNALLKTFQREDFVTSSESESKFIYLVRLINSYYSHQI